MSKYPNLNVVGAIALRQALEIGVRPHEAHILADAAKKQATAVRYLADHPNDGRTRVDLEFLKEFIRLLAGGDEAWYARAAASLKAGDLAIEIGEPINWRTLIKNAGIVAEADCSGTDEEASEAAEAAKAAMRARVQELM